MALTRADHFLLCGAYEALALKKPLILSDTRDLRDYFRKGVIFTENTAPAIAQAIQFAIQQKDGLAKNVAELAHELQRNWQATFDDLLGLIDRLPRS
jgi:glycosyltransferase involved in cell wall biosynthesis